MKCTCEKIDYLCQCREGKSFLIVGLLNQLFEICSNQPTAQQIYDWTKSLSFCHSSTYAYGVDRLIIKELQENHALRQAVHLVGFNGLEGRDEVVKQLRFFQRGSSGLSFKEDDYQVIIDHAFNTGNLVLWSCFIIQPDLYNPKMDVSKQQLRAHMRKQAREKTEFNKVWTQCDRVSREGKKQYQKNKIKKNRSMKRVERRKNIKRKQYFDENIASIKSGNDWSWLCYFARRYLYQYTKGHAYFEEGVLPEQQALQNCFTSFRKHVKKALNELGPYDDGMGVLQAACLVQFRAKGHLFDIDLDVLRAVKKNFYKITFQIDCFENETFEDEINRHIFKTEKDIEQFARECIEPQLLNSEVLSSDVAWFSNRKEFVFLLGSLSLEWLKRFPDMEQNALGILFDNVARHGDVVKLKELIKIKVTKIGEPPKNTDLRVKYNERRKFWLLEQFFFIDEICCESCDWLKEDKDHIFDIESIAGSFRSSNSVWPTLSAEKIYLVLDLFIKFWPKVFLPSSWGTGDPKEEAGYRFLKYIIWDIRKDKPSNSIPILEKILQDQKFSDYHNDTKNILFTVKKTRALQDYQVPSPNAIVALLDNLKIASVEDLRAFLLEEFDVVQQWVVGGDGRSFFYETYEKNRRVDENTATKRIVNQLQLKCKALGLSITIEHQLADNKRCDFTVRCNIDGSEKMLVVEVKGQWHRELYTAAAEQLHKRYSIHPSAEKQGVFLILWFGTDEKVAGRKDENISTPEQLKDKVIEKMPSELHDLIDVVVLDLA